MIENPISSLEELVLAYESAYRQSVTLDGDTNRRMLLASRPLRAEYDAVHKAVRAAAEWPRHSDAFVVEYVDELLQAALDNPGGITDEVLRLQDFLIQPITTKLYIPLDGVTIESADLLLGSIRLVQMNPESFENLIIKPFERILSKNPAYHGANASAVVENHRQRLQSLLGRTCVEVTTDADLSETFTKADDVADDVCDFLQLCIAAFRPRQLSNPVRWSDGIVNAWRWSFGISNGPKARSNSSGQLAYGGPPAIIGNSSIVKLQEYGVLALGRRLGMTCLSEYEALLRRSVRWFAKGERERNADDRKLAYVTAVDLFFSRPGRGATQRFCNGFAFATSDDTADIVRFARLNYFIYSSRSETTHEGAFNIESDDDVDQLRWRVLRLLTRMGSHSFSDKEQIEAWVASRHRLLSSSERNLLSEATDRKVVEQDLALIKAINLIGSGSQTLSYDVKAHQSMVLRQILIDAFHQHKFVVKLRPFAHRLASALEAAVNLGGDPLPIALKVLVSLPWVEESFRARLASDMT